MPLDTIANAQQVSPIVAAAQAVEYSDADGVTHRFVGTQVGYDCDGTWEAFAYLTSGQRIAVLSDSEVLSVYDTFEEFAEGFVGRPYLVSAVADALHVKWVHVLDI